MPRKLFQRGQSGNPEGRPKSDIHVADLARRHGPEAIELLLKIIRGEVKADAYCRLRAAETLLNRGFGLPKASVDVNGLQQAFVAVLPAPMASAEEWSIKAQQMQRERGAMLLDHAEFQPAPVIPMQRTDTET